MAAIFAAGSDAGSAPVSRGRLARLLEWLGMELSPAALEGINFLGRKSGHVLSYALLAVLLVRLFRRLSANLSAAEVRLAWVAAVGWAVVDETHQWFYASRGASTGDVLLDAAGAAAGLLLYLRCAKRWQRQ